MNIVDVILFLITIWLLIKGYREGLVGNILKIIINFISLIFSLKLSKPFAVYLGNKLNLLEKSKNTIIHKMVESDVFPATYASKELITTVEKIVNGMAIALVFIILLIIFKLIGMIIIRKLHYLIEFIWDSKLDNVLGAIAYLFVEILIIYSIYYLFNNFAGISTFDKYIKLLENSYFFNFVVNFFK